MTEQRLGRHDQARAALDRLREVSAKREGDEDEAAALRREAEALLAGTPAGHSGG